MTIPLRYIEVKKNKLDRYAKHISLNQFKCGESIEITSIIFLKNGFAFYIDEVTRCLTRAPKTINLCCIKVDPFPWELFNK